MPQYKHGIIVADTEVVQDHGGNSFCWIASVMTTMSRRHQKSDWSNLKILTRAWYRKFTSPCVSFTIYQQCNGDIEGDVTPTLLQYQNVHWGDFILWLFTVFSLMNLSRDFILCYDFMLRVYFYNLINYAKMKVYLDNFVDKTSVIFI